MVFHPLLSDEVCHRSSFKFYSAYRRRRFNKVESYATCRKTQTTPNTCSVSNFPQLLPTTRNNMRSVQTDVKCIIQQCWELLAHNVAFVCTGLYALKNIVKETISGSCFVLLSLYLLLLFIVIIYYHLNLSKIRGEATPKKF